MRPTCARTRGGGTHLRAAARPAWCPSRVASSSLLAEEGAQRGLELGVVVLVVGVDELRGQHALTVEQEVLHELTPVPQLEREQRRGDRGRTAEHLPECRCELRVGDRV